MSSTTVVKSPSEDRLSLATVLTFVSAGIPAAILLGMLGVFLPRYFSHYFPNPKTALGVIGVTLAGVRTIDTLGVDLPIGWLMDKIRTPFGRYRPWFVAGAPIVMVGAYMLFNPPRHMTSSYLAGWYLFLWVGISMMTIANSAWGASLARDYNDRSRLFAWAIPVAILGAAWLNLAPAVTHGKFGPGNYNDVPTIGWIAIGLTALDHLHRGHVRQRAEASAGAAGARRA